MALRRPPRVGRPADFDSFWSATRAQLDSVPAAVRREPGGERRGELELEELSFASLDGVRVRGYLIHARDDQPRPLVIHSHGYEGEAARMWSWAANGLDVAGVDVRGFGRSLAALPEPSPFGYVLTGAMSGHTHVLRGAVCDYMRTVEVAQAVSAVAPGRLVLQGTSFAGGLATMAEARLQEADLLVLRVPSLGWTEGRLALAQAGSAAQVNAYLAEHPQSAERLLAALSYFDTMNFAAAICCPTLVGLGRSDHVVPAETVEAMVSRLRAPHELVELPVSHSDSPEEARWNDFEREWLTLARHGTPAGFGTSATPRPPLPL